MPLLKKENNEERLKLQEDWFAVRRFVKERFGKRPDINALLFLIGVNEIAINKETWTKEEKKDLMHIAICTLYSKKNYYALEFIDKDGWPHFKVLKTIPKGSLKEQENDLKQQIINYFKQQKYIY